MHLFCSGAVPLIGCSAPDRVQCPRAVGGFGGCRGYGALLGLSCLLLGVLCGAFEALCSALRCGSSEMSHAIPPHVFQTLTSNRWDCNVFGCCGKVGHPNCMRVLVDEAPKANSCVRSSSHDTIHDPRDASNTSYTLKCEEPTNRQQLAHRPKACNITTIFRRKTTTSSHNRHLTGRRHTHPLNEVSTSPA